MNCLISMLIYTISRRSFEYQKHVTVFNSPISTDSMPEKNNDKISGQIPEIPQIPFVSDQIIRHEHLIYGSRIFMTRGW